MKSFTYKKLFLYVLLLLIPIPSWANNLSSTEKSFVIVIPSYNNQKWYARNLQSVLSQDYPHFRAIYTDDCSPDNTGKLVEAYLELNDPHNTVTLVKNKVRRGALHNLYTMIHSCDDDEIIVTLDGDDWFPDEDVLTRLNTVYSSREIWLTYGQFQLHPSGIRGWASPMPDYIVENNAFRDFQHLPTHLRTFYAWLFKKIKLEDLLHLGVFYPMTWDMAMMFPMIEMASERHQFIPEIMYTYNDENTISDHHVSRQLQAHLAQIIKKKNRYKRLPDRPTKPRHNYELKTDVIIFAQKPNTLIQLLESLKMYVTGVDRTFVMYKPMSLLETDEYNAIKTLYPTIEFCLISDHRSNFRDALFALYQKAENNYILFAKGDAFFQKPLSLSTCINTLQETSAYAFYFKLNAEDGMRSYQTLPLVEYKDTIFVWNFALARDKWSSANSLDLVLHKKTDFLAQALQSHYDLTPNGLEAVWANEGNLDRLGLCFGESTILLHL
ncbi:MAG TPA: glycosyltransferase family 2 protein [Candidatus Babeliales bacterium]|nr:glycosyltransferase family 2 protein [Candidatus Babeliales bacterium]HLC07493.1 glycosyltransferase family 2 protein [Candidatus Babeliales bacterium]